MKTSFSLFCLSMIVTLFMSGAALAQQVVIASALGDDVITFSEFPIGTFITTQYADRGIIFGGDSPFITDDVVHVTSPVLSGTPEFLGDIAGMFVDPADGVTPMVVSAFAFDAGNFDNLGSTQVQWFDANGNLLGSQTNSQLGIEHFEITDCNIASFSIGIITAEAAGFSIDNVTFATESDAVIEAVDDSAMTDEDTPVAIDVLANDSASGCSTVMSVVSVSTPANGTVAINPDSTVTYTPNSNFTGDDSFTYTMMDDNGATDTATVNVTVINVNDAPNAVDDVASTSENTPVTIDVLANDSDPDGDTLNVISVSAASNGVGVINADNTITYTPNTDFVGTDSFTYTMNDDNGATDTATVFIDVLVSNEAPSCDTAYPSPDTLWSPNHEMVEVMILGLTDADGDGIILVITDITISDSAGGDGGVHHDPDIGGIGTSIAQIRAERSGLGSGRTYTIFFNASDGQGADCNGSVIVFVPHDRSDNSANSSDTVPDVNVQDNAVVNNNGDEGSNIQSNANANGNGRHSHGHGQSNGQANGQGNGNTVDQNNGQGNGHANGHGNGSPRNNGNGNG